MAISWMMSSTSSSAFSTSMILMATEWPVRLSTLKGRRIASQQQSPAIPFNSDRREKISREKSPARHSRTCKLTTYPLNTLPKLPPPASTIALGTTTKTAKHPPNQQTDQCSILSCTEAPDPEPRWPRPYSGSAIPPWRLSWYVILVTGSALPMGGNVEWERLLARPPRGQCRRCADHKAMRSMMARLAACVRERKRQFSVYVNESRKPGRAAGNGRWCLMMHGIKGMRWKRPSVVSAAGSCWR